MVFWRGYADFKNTSVLIAIILTTLLDENYFTQPTCYVNQCNPMVIFW